MNKNIISEPEDNPEKPEKKRDKNNKPVNVFGALFFITLGTVFLLNNLGILPWGIWSILWRFWPIFLIMAGLQILAGKSRLASIIVFGLGIGLITTVLVYSISITNPGLTNYIDSRLPFINNLREYVPTNPGNLVNNKFLVSSKEYENISKVVIDMELGAGKFTVEDNDEDYFLYVDADYYTEYGKPEIRTKQEGDTLIVSLTAKRGRTQFLGGVDELEYEIRIGKSDIAKDIDINLGAGSLDSKFDQTEILNFYNQLGAGKITTDIEDVSLPQEAIELDVGAGSMNVRLPSRTFAKFDYDIGVGILDVDGKRLRGSGEFTMTNFSITEDPLPVRVNIGAGTVNINF